MKNEKINTEIQNVNTEKNTANEKWETPEINKIDINMTENTGPNAGNDSLQFYS
nr:hypothetical protein [uncultured Draconibacterium sp.]